MSVQLTPKGTRGLKMPKLPPAAWRVVNFFLTLRVRMRGGHVLELTTVGGKSGLERMVTLRYFPDGQDRWLIVASLD